MQLRLSSYNAIEVVPDVSPGHALPHFSSSPITDWVPPVSALGMPPYSHSYALTLVLFFRKEAVRPVRLSGSAGAQQHACLTFMFADGALPSFPPRGMQFHWFTNVSGVRCWAAVCAFTNLCAAVSTTDVLTLLDDLFTTFDSHLDEFGVYKGISPASPPMPSMQLFVFISEMQHPMSEALVRACFLGSVLSRMGTSFVRWDRFLSKGCMPSCVLSQRSNQKPNPPAVDTMGDGYFAVCGTDADTAADHATRMLGFANALLQAVAQQRLRLDGVHALPGEPLQVRQRPAALWPPCAHSSGPF